MDWTPEQIKALRLHVGWTPERFGEHLGYGSPRQRAYDLEAGRQAPGGGVRKLLDALARKHRFKGTR
jgi:DNA-binding transcriptional regulator YiaG